MPKFEAKVTITLFMEVEAETEDAAIKELRSMDDAELWEIAYDVVHDYTVMVD